MTNKADSGLPKPVEHVSQCVAKTIEHLNQWVAKAKPVEHLEECVAKQVEHLNQCVVEALYEALACGDTGTVMGFLVPELEWRFHGPPRCQHMMRVLTGESDHTDFRFLPKGITAVGSWVIVEGWEGEHAYWVHVWMLEEGVITQFREYFNTWIVVRELNPPVPAWETRGRRRGPTVWQSGQQEWPSRSLPGLVLAL
ncbi:hypothetical protein Taro_052544 [Colocasia esculenta]|uniref:Uncharacterized protein n=1 Tax=Colocasia esculenta TaxID=4460 RepID=A0A843XIR3_COLES|nr:hypothetical protein [Colocasia esculenta]